MTPLQNDAWPWSQATLPAAMSPSDFDFNASGLDYFDMALVGDDQPESSVPSSEHTTPVVDLVASPDIAFLGDDGLLDAHSQSHSQSLQLVKLPQNIWGFPAAAAAAAPPLSASTDCVLGAAAAAATTQPPLMVLPLKYEFAGDYTSPLFAPLDDFDSALFTAAAAVEPSTLSDPPKAMLGSVLNSMVPTMLFRTLPNMDMGGTVPMGAAASPMPPNAALAVPAAPAVPARCPCPMCPRDFATPALMRKHQKRHNKEYACGVCAKQCGAQKERDRHMWVHHAEQARLQGIRSVDEACPEPGCAHTGRKDNVRRHYKTKHAHAVPS